MGEVSSTVSVRLGMRDETKEAALAVAAMSAHIEWSRALHVVF